MEIEFCKRYKNLCSTLGVPRTKHGVLNWIPPWLCNVIVLGQIFDFMQKNYSSSNIVIRVRTKGEYWRIISIEDIEDDWWCVIKSGELEVEIFRFIIQWVVGLLNHLGFAVLFIWGPNLNIRVRGSWSIAGWQVFGLVNVSSNMIWVSSFRQFLLPAGDRVRLKIAIFVSLVNIQSKLENTRFVELCALSNS